MRVVKPQSEDHVFRATEDWYEILLVGGGRRAYLYVGPQLSHRGGITDAYTFAGAKALRSLAKAILKEIP